MPSELGGIDGLPRLVEALRARGYDDEALAKITHGNWLRVLGETWRRWGRYFELAGDDPRRRCSTRSSRFDEPGLAVDLGAGTGRDTAELLRRGWNVIAIDGEREAIERLTSSPGARRRGSRPVSRASRSEKWPACDLVNASFSLPFAPPERVRRAVDADRRLAAPGRPLQRPALRRQRRVGRSGPGREVARRGRAMLAPFEIERLQEVDADGTTAIGTRKHWHVFHIVARKR